LQSNLCLEPPLSVFFFFSFDFWIARSYWWWCKACCVSMCRCCSQSVLCWRILTPMIHWCRRLLTCTRPTGTSMRQLQEAGPRSMQWAKLNGPVVCAMESPSPTSLCFFPLCINACCLFSLHSKRGKTGPQQRPKLKKKRLCFFPSHGLIWHHESCL